MGREKVCGGQNDRKIDMESPNGVMYQGERIDQLVPTDGDCVNLAPKVALRFASIPLTKKFLPI